MIYYRLIDLHNWKDVNAYFANIEKNAAAKIQVKIKESIIDELTPNFEIRGVDGKPVLLSDFKGKIIVLDFWATWCVPCKKSLPAMQMVANMYKKDPKVKFLFIHTWERSNNPKEEAIKHLADNNFQLDLYMDTFDPIIQVNPAINAFGVKSIPAKFVIDGRGRTRFKLNGFSGGDNAAVKDLSTIINILKVTNDERF